MVDVTEGVEVDKVIERMKLEVGYYEYLRQKLDNTPINNVCGGSIDFEIQQVKLTLTTSYSTEAGTKASLIVPIVSVPTSSIGLSASTSVILSNSQNLTFYARPKRPITFIPPENVDSSQFLIARSLLGLRESLLKASYMTPCFDLAHKTNEPLPSYEVEFVMTKKAAGAIDLRYAIISAGPSYTLTSAAGNKMLVTFVPTGSAAMMQGADR